MSQCDGFRCLRATIEQKSGFELDITDRNYVERAKWGQASVKFYDHKKPLNCPSLGNN